MRIASGPRCKVSAPAPEAFEDLKLRKMIGHLPGRGRRELRGILTSGHRPGGHVHFEQATRAEAAGRLAGENGSTTFANLLLQDFWFVHAYGFRIGPGLLQPNRGFLSFQRPHQRPQFFIDLAIVAHGASDFPAE